MTLWDEVWVMKDSTEDALKLTMGNSILYEAKEQQFSSMSNSQALQTIFRSKEINQLAPSYILPKGRAWYNLVIFQGTYWDILSDFMAPETRDQKSKICYTFKMDEFIKGKIFWIAHLIECLTEVNHRFVQ